MFMTHAALEQAVPLSMLPPGARVWRTVELSLRSPWFLVVVEDPLEEVIRDLLLSSEVELEELIQACPNAIKRVEIVSPHCDEPRWAMHKVKKIWKRAEPSGFTQWIYEHDDGTKAYCPPCSTVEREEIYASAEQFLELA
ncbi:MAG: hypothetical protein EPO09_03380 [Aquabacterium sp.]|uniref:hypothetical protein n=1 Tax=Aquabacterium sp. TaxID=1872578 RepID=UPI00121E4498|nr:hypothetical protein [Aquabacterium sp.]TAK97749.1 MAG: hypothetical protein EPO09_03380 [Aquabacterium sp.]